MGRHGLHHAGEQRIRLLLWQIMAAASCSNIAFIMMVVAGAVFLAGRAFFAGAAFFTAGVAFTAGLGLAAPLGTALC